VRNVAANVEPEKLDLGVDVEWRERASLKRNEAENVHNKNPMSL